jgi:hypothetical protein
MGKLGSENESDGTNDPLILVEEVWLLPRHHREGP